MAGTTPALADSQNQGPFVQTNLNHGAIHNDGRDHDGDRDSWDGYDRDSDGGRYYHNDDDGDRNRDSHGFTAPSRGSLQRRNPGLRSGWSYL